MKSTMKSTDKRSRISMGMLTLVVVLLVALCVFPAIAGAEEGETTTGEPAVSYEVTFDACNGSEVTTVTATAGAKITAPALANRIGFTFGGWWTAKTGGTCWDFATDTVNADLTLYGCWVVSDPVGEDAGYETEGTDNSEFGRQEAIPLADTGDSAAFVSLAFITLSAATAFVLVKRKA